VHAPVDPPKSLLTRHRAMLVLICVSAPSFMLQLDANIVAVSLPSISESLRANFAGIEWVVTAYTLSFASLLLPAGALADRFGRKRVLMTGLVLFTVASFFCGAAPDLATLITARAFQGIGAAPQKNEASVKSPRPAIRTRLRPNRSARAPAGNSSEAKDSV